MVSVVLPCRNAARYLDEALQSIHAQTFQDWELVVVDDGSTDGTADLLNRWARRDHRIRRVVNSGSAGIVGALNTGWKAARGELIARMDADDVAHPNRLAHQVAYLESHPEVALVSCQVDLRAEGGSSPGWERYIHWCNSCIEHEDIVRGIFIESPVPHPSILIRRSWLVQVGGYRDAGWPEDYDLWFRLWRIGARFGKVPERLLTWRDHRERWSRRDPRYSPEAFRRLKAHMLARTVLVGRDALFIWGAGQVGPRIARHLSEEGYMPEAFVDIDPKKIGRTRRWRPVLSPEEFRLRWSRFRAPLLLAAVGTPGAREEIRARLEQWGMVETQDWWAVA